jgi:hypothetical protein
MSNQHLPPSGRRNRKSPLTSHDERSNRKLLIVTPPNSPPAGLVALDGHEADNKLTFTIKIPA